MKIYKNTKFLFLIFTILILLIYFNIKKDTKKSEIKNNVPKVIEEVYSSNIIENVNYNAKDNKGNEYKINAAKGEIDISNSDIIFLTDVVALIKLKGSDNIKITSKFGKYNIKNYDTIFSKNVLVKYLNNNIKS